MQSDLATTDGPTGASLLLYQAEDGGRARRIARLPDRSTVAKNYLTSDEISELSRLP